jgi:peptide chain release factor 3
VTSATTPEFAPAYAAEISRRRTFAIISHPDAGKTTLTEKLLLYGGAIHLAGAVKARRQARAVTSDWMSIEKERGISVTTAAIQFPYKDHMFNLLDTPGHQDFSEDTYRTICAADSAVMLVDAAKGVEPQTEKLFKVCRLREMPIFTFVNKWDREGRTAFDLMDEIEKLLGIRCVAANWPLGSGRTFCGVYDRFAKKALLFERGEDKGARAQRLETTLDDPYIRETIGEAAYQETLENLELLDGLYDPWDQAKFLAGDFTPVYFGSALNNFGVEPFLEAFGQLAPPPRARHVPGGLHGPEAPGFSGFIFKIQANMDRNHRDRMAFLRVVSGRFQRGMEVFHVREGRNVRLNNAVTFFAQERVTIEESYAGDIVGLHDPGIFRIGDTLTGGEKFQFEGIPRFCPERFARVKVPNPLKRKRLDKGLQQLSEEGTIAVLQPPGGILSEPILAAVGQLQFEVVKHRLLEEYDCEVLLEPLQYSSARWVAGGPFSLRDFEHPGISAVYTDTRGCPIVLFRDEWTLRHALRTHDKVIFTQTAPDVPPAIAGLSA